MSTLQFNSTNSATPNNLTAVNGVRGNAIEPMDRGIAYGDGLFETLLLKNGCLPYWDLHRSRLARGSSVLHLAIDWQRINVDVNSLLGSAKAQGITEGVLKIIVTRGVQGRGYQPSLETQTTIITSLHPLPETVPTFVNEGVDTMVCKYRLPSNPYLAGVKHLNKLDYVIASMEWDRSRYQEALLLDNRDQVVEAIHRNVFIVKDNTLITSPLSHCGVAGVMRQLLIETIAPKLGINVAEKDFDVASMRDADEVFVCNSITGLWPIKTIDGKAVGRGRICDRLNQAVAKDLLIRCEQLGVVP